MQKRQFGELEHTILRIMQEGNRMTVKEVHRILGEKDNYNTIMTVMLRLSKKKMLGREKKGVHYEYWLLQKQQTVPTLFQQLKTKLFGYKPIELVSYLLSNKEISLEELEEIEKLIKKSKKTKK